MNEHDATELAYNNGYKQGTVDAVRKMAERLKDRYEFDCNADEDNALYYVDLCEWVERIAKEILDGGETNDTV